MWLAFVAAFPLASVHRLQVPNTLRRPSYTAGVLMNAGIGLGLGSWGSATLLVVASVAVYSYRMAVEERALLSAVGEPYRECMRTRKRLIPFLY